MGKNENFSIDLGNSNITSLPNEVLSNPNIESINLSNNYINTLSGIQNLKNLKSLDLSNCRLNLIPQELTLLDNLNFLNISGNPIDSYKGLEELISLKFLQLSNVGLNSIPSEIFKLIYLNTLNISNKRDGLRNKLLDIDKEISNLKELKHLYISNVGLKKIPYSIMLLSNLTYLDISINKISEVPEEIAYLDSINNLIIKNNPITNVPKEIIDSHNSIELIREYFFSKKNSAKKKINTTNVLDLRNKNLIEFPSKYLLYRDTQKILLSGNNIKSLKGVQRFENLEILDIGNCNFSVFPQELVGIKSLTDLCLAENPLISFHGLERLSNLEYLDISNLRLEKIPQEIYQLRNLRTLIIVNNDQELQGEIKYIESDLGNLDRITHLTLSGLGLRKFPEGILKMKELKHLDLSNNDIEELPQNIIKLTGLRVLDLKNNPIKYPPPEVVNSIRNVSAIRNYLRALNKNKEENDRLYELKLLIVGEARVGKTTLAEAISNPNFIYKENRKSTHGIDITRLLIPKHELNIAQKNGYTGKKKLKTISLKEKKLFRRGQRRNSFAFKKLYKIKYKIEHEKKTIISHFKFYLKQSLKDIIENGWILPIAKFFGYKFDPEREKKVKIPTKKARDFEEWSHTRNLEVADESAYFRINIWDFGGQEIYYATHQFFLTKRSLYFIVTEARKDINHDYFYYWLNVVELLGGKSPVILIMSKSDEPNVGLPFTTYKKKFKNIVGDSYYSVSCFPEKKYTINHLREVLKNIITDRKYFPDIGAYLPKDWLDIRMELEVIRQKGRKYISYVSYLKLCSKYHMDEERSEFLSEFFHDLGVFLHFKDDFDLKDTIFLNFEWVTHAVYKVLDNQDIIDKQGRFSTQNLRDIWKEDELLDKQRELLSLMKSRKFELCFEIGRDEFLAPILLKEQEKPVKWNTSNDVLKFEYQYEFMPKGIMARFIVKRHIDIFENTYWKHGVLLEYKGAKALIKENIISSPKRISISIEGDNKREYLAIIRKTFEEIHSSFTNLQIDEMVPCVCSTCKLSKKTHFYYYRDLRRRTVFKKSNVECPVSYEELSVVTLLEGVGNYLNPTLKYIKELISSGRIDEALDNFEKYLHGSSRVELKSGIINLKSRFNSNKFSYSKSIISYSEYMRENNQIVEGLLSLLVKGSIS